MYFTYITNPSISTLELVYVRNRKFGNEKYAPFLCCCFGFGLWMEKVVENVGSFSSLLCIYTLQKIHYTHNDSSIAWRWPGHGIMGPYEYIYSMRSYSPALPIPQQCVQVQMLSFTSTINSHVCVVQSVYVWRVCICNIIPEAVFPESMRCEEREFFIFPTCREFSLSSYALSCSIHVYMYKIRIYSFSCPLCQPTDC